MTTSLLILATFVTLGSGEGDHSPDPPPPPSAAVDVDTKTAAARKLYTKGRALYSSANYTEAIDAFTKSLELLQSSGSMAGSLDLIYNIAVAHERQFEIDGDVSHLKKAHALYSRYHEYHSSHGDLDSELEYVLEIKRLDAKIKKEESLSGPPSPSPSSSQPEPRRTHPAKEHHTDSSWFISRYSQISFFTGGAILLVGGIAVAVTGAQYKRYAESQVEGVFSEGSTFSPRVKEEATLYVGEHARAGKSMMIAGAITSTLGVVALGVGSFITVRLKRKVPSEISAAPLLSSGTAGVMLSGRF